jgi:hypothetical protein
MAWVLAIGLNYWLFLSRLSANQELVGYWTEGFPRLTSVIGFVGWARSTFMDVFERTMDLELAPAAALAFLIGCYVVIKRRKRGISAALLLPWGFCFIAGLLHYYPFKDRLILFLIPSVVLIVAMGFESFFRPARGTLVAAIGILLALTALSGIVGTMTEDGVDGFPDERLRPVLQRLSTESRPGDAIMLWRRSAPQFRYYAQVYDFPLPESRTHLTEGQDPRAILQPLLGGGRRVWLISAQKYGKVHARYAQENDVAVVRDEIQVGQSGAVLLISRAPR